MKTYIDNNNITVFICPSCLTERHIDITNITKKNLNIKCSCGKITNISIEYRNYFRKNLNILGELLINANNINILLINLSQKGLRFKILNKFKFFSKFNINDLITVIFVLNEKIVIKKCKIKNKNNNAIGVEFMDENFSKEIGFYLID